VAGSYVPVAQCFRGQSCPGTVRGKRQ
jgi:hypothetical protein